MSQQQNGSVFLTPATVLMIIGVMLVATLMVYGASVSYGFSKVDDPYLVTNNLIVRGPTPEHLLAAFTTYDPELYIPLTFVSYQLDWLIAELHPTMFHFTNLLLHALNATLVAYLVYLLLGRLKIGIAIGLLFAIHPLNAEAAVWVAARKDLLSTFFYLLSIILYLRYRYEGSVRSYRLSIVAFLLGLLSKVTVGTLPVALLLLEALMREQKEWNRKVFLELVPYAALSGVFFWIALLGKERIVGSSTLLKTGLMAAKSTIFYLQKMIVPTDLTIFYPYQKAIVLSSPDFYVPLIIVAALVGIALWSLRYTKWIALMCAMFLMSLAPSFLNFHKGTQIFFAVDRYAYLPMIWLLVLFASLCVLLSDLRSKQLRQGIAFFLAMWVAWIGVIGSNQATYWKSDEMLFDRALALYPESEPARLSLAALYRKQGRNDAEKKVLQEGSAYDETVAYLTGLGSVAVREGRLDEAQRLYEKALALDPANPEPFFFLGSLDEERGDLTKAMEHYRKAIALDPSYVSAINNLAAILLDGGKYAESAELFRQALTWNPSFMEGHYNVFRALEMLKKNDEAFDHLRKAYALSPDIGEIALAYGYRLHERKRDREAVAVLQRLLTIEPDNRTAKRLLDEINK